MNWRLGKGKAVRNMEVCWFPSSACLWPSQIIELDGLDTFSLRRGLSAPDRPFSALHLSTLSRNLKKLELQEVASIDALDGLYSVNRYHFRQLETLYLDFSSNIETLKFDLPPTLRDLSIRFASPTPGLKCSFELPIGRLPPHLTQLDCRVKSLGIGKARFPNTLTKMKIEFNNPQPRWPLLFHVLPSGIESLTLKVGNPDEPISVDDWTALSTLTKLKYLDLDIKRSLVIPEAQLLPRSIEVLQLCQKEQDNRSEAWWSSFLVALPPNIKRLNFFLHGQWPDVKYRFSRELALKLPKTLECTEEIFHPDAVSSLPPSITKFTLGEGDSSVISSFPPNLLHLEFWNFNSSLLGILPRTLQTFKYDYGSAWRCGFSLKSVRSLPRNLTTLSFPLISIPTDINPSAIDQFYSLLPPTLTVLVYGAKEDPFLFPNSRSSQFLPRGLKSLFIASPTEFSQCDMAEWIVGLPKTLTCFEIDIDPPSKSAFSAFGTLTNLKELIIQTPKAPDSWTKRIDFKSLPRSLTKFHLDDDPYRLVPEKVASDITDDLLIGAPRCLEDLSLPHSPYLSKECLAHLPKLESLTLIIHTPTWFTY
jgi:hypothetical protein